MSDPRVPNISRFSWLEHVLAAAIVGGIIYCLWHLARYSYLPAPFFYEPSDTYADWFNTAFWARQEGTYDVWQTIYPPLSFVFIRIFGIDRCYPDRGSFDVSAGLAARDCDWLGLMTIWGGFFLNIALCWFAFRKTDRRTALPRTICVALGMPMLNALERGNLILISLACMILAFGPLLKSARLKWLAAGLAVNFKVYLIATIVPLLLKRRWRWVECALLSVLLVYLLSYAMLGRGTPMEIYENIRFFSSQTAANILDIWYTTTYQQFVTLLEGDNYPLTLLIGSRNVELLLLLLPGLKYLTQALIVAAAIAIWLRPEAVPAYRAINLGLMMALVTSEPGAYAQAYFMFFIMLEPWRGFGRCWAIVACYILALPLDIHVDQLPEVARDTYFGNTTALVTFHISIGPFIRPLIVMTIAWAIAAVTIRDVWSDIRTQGWAERWRFRRDVPMLPWIRRPVPPAPGSSSGSPSETAVS